MYQGPIEWETHWKEDRNSGRQLLSYFETHSEMGSCYTVHVTSSLIYGYYNGDSVFGIDEKVSTDEECREYLDNFANTLAEYNSYYNRDYITPTQFYNPYWDSQNQYWVCQTDTPWEFRFIQAFCVERSYRQGCCTTTEEISGGLKTLEACEQVVRNDWYAFTGK